MRVCCVCEECVVCGEHGCRNWVVFICCQHCTSTCMYYYVDQQICHMYCQHYTSQHGQYTKIYYITYLRFLFIMMMVVQMLVRWYKHSSEQTTNIISWIDQNMDRSVTTSLNNDVYNITSWIEHCLHCCV